MSNSLLYHADVECTATMSLHSRHQNKGADSIVSKDFSMSYFVSKLNVTVEDT